MTATAETDDLRRAHEAEVRAGERFTFGANWRAFLEHLDDERISRAVESVSELLDQDDLSGLRFLDLGSGSGLFSLAARKLGADIVSVDYDPESVACTSELRRRYFGEDDSGWRVEHGSALDGDYLESLGDFDVVYSWGVLHHTGEMWRGIDNAGVRVRPGGRLVLALYNNQGFKSRAWTQVKRVYCSGNVGRGLVSGVFIPWWVGRGVALDLLRRKSPLSRYREYKRERGMSVFHDWLDWLGGYPFEVAKPDAVLEFLRPRGFLLEKLQSVGAKLGNNQFVFRREA